MRNFIKSIPKAELHIHIEGTLEPELMFAIAKRNGIALKFSTEAALRQAYQFSNLQDFLNIYYEGTAVLLHSVDFYELTIAYFRRAKTENIVHTEIMFDPQAHTLRGIAFKTIIDGIGKAQIEAEKSLGITSCLIMNFLRHLTEEDAFKTLEESLPFREMITAVGLDSSELGNPPEKFENVFAKAKEYGYITVAHAGEEGPAENLWGAIDLLKVSRIDHGNSAMSDADLIETLVETQIPLTVCPLSNLKLKVIENLSVHPLKKMLELGIKATINSDDPAYFGGYLNDNYLAIAEAQNLSESEIKILAKNSFSASFLPDEEKNRYVEIINRL